MMPDLGSSSRKLCACALLSSLLVRHSAQDGWGASVYLLYYVTEDPGPILGVDNTICCLRMSGRVQFSRV